MDDTSLLDDHSQSHNDVGSLQIGSATLNADLINLILQIQSNPLDKPSEQMNRGCWTQQEDDQLMSAVEQLGSKKWTDIARFVPSRTSKQCRERWFNRLRPDLKHEPFEPWEDHLIIQKQKEIGNRWAMIAKELPGRSTNSIKNRWYSALRTQSDVSAQLSINPTDLLQNPIGGEDLMIPGQSIHESSNNNDL